MFVYEKQKLKSKLILYDDVLHIEPDVLKEKGLYKIFWILSGEMELIINHQPYRFKEGEVISLSHLHSVEVGRVDGKSQALFFNDNFYSIALHDHEVMCDGVLFNGSPHIVKFSLTSASKTKLQTFIAVMIEEFSIEDDLQDEMLRILLKRLIITCCRLTRNTHGLISQHNKRFDTMRKFYILVDEHFREKKQVQDYATILHKSPKTLANILLSFHQPSAIKIIHNRIIIEAKNLLHYTSKSSKEIAHILGFTDHASFSRFFRNVTGQSPTGFRRNSR